MGKISGLGGLFLKAKDPKALTVWYQEKLGIAFDGKTYIDLPFKDQDGKAALGYNVLSFFPESTKYFEPGTSPVMINLRVEGMEEFLEELKQRGVVLTGEPLMEEYGKFAWIVDPEGNKIELWEPPST